MADIYINHISDICEAVYPPERQLQIETTASPKLKALRFAAWQALLSGIGHSLSVNPESLMFYRDENSVWRCKCSGVCFSLTHTGSFGAAAVSKSPVGLDAETETAVKSRPAENLQALILRCCTLKEQAMYSSAGFAPLWTKKESIFKFSGEKNFSPSKIETSDFPVKTYRCGELIVSVCSDESAHRFFEIRDGKICPIEAEQI